MGWIEGNGAADAARAAGSAQVNALVQRVLRGVVIVDGVLVGVDARVGANMDVWLSLSAATFSDATPKRLKVLLLVMLLLCLL